MTPRERLMHQRLTELLDQRRQATRMLQSYSRRDARQLRAGFDATDKVYKREKFILTQGEK